MTNLLEVRRLGRKSYAEVHTLQEELLEQRISGGLGDVLILTEEKCGALTGSGKKQLGKGGISLYDVSSAIDGENLNMPGGNVDVGDENIVWGMGFRLSGIYEGIGVLWPSRCS